jgi:hypothetical protein
MRLSHNVCDSSQALPSSENWYSSRQLLPIVSYRLNSVQSHPRQVLYPYPVLAEFVDNHLLPCIVIQI